MLANIFTDTAYLYSWSSHMISHSSTAPPRGKYRGLFEYFKGGIKAKELCDTVSFYVLFYVCPFTNIVNNVEGTRLYLSLQP